MRGNTGAPVKFAVESPRQGRNPGRTEKSRLVPPPTTVIKTPRTVRTRRGRSLPPPSSSLMVSSEGRHHDLRPGHEDRATRRLAATEPAPPREAASLARDGFQHDALALPVSTAAVEDAANARTATDPAAAHHEPPPVDGHVDPVPSGAAHRWGRRRCRWLRRDAPRDRLTRHRERWTCSDPSRAIGDDEARGARTDATAVPCLSVGAPEHDQRAGGE